MAKKPRKKKWRKTKLVLAVAGVIGFYTEFLDQDYEYRAITGKDSYTFYSPSIVEGNFEGYKVRTTDKERRPVIYLVATESNAQPQVIFAEIGLYFYDFKVCIGNRKPKSRATSIDDITGNCFEIDEQEIKRSNGFWSQYKPNFNKTNSIKEWRPWYSLNIWKDFFPTYFNDEETIGKIKGAYNLAERARNQVLNK